MSSGVVAVELTFGITVSDYPLLVSFPFTGPFVGLPQLYLAGTGTTVTPRSRVRFTSP